MSTLWGGHHGDALLSPSVTQRLIDRVARHPVIGDGANQPVFMKLQARDRVQAVIFAYESRLVSPGRGG